jgi:Anthranilate/para-aminobenzoate synthases component I
VERGRLGRYSFVGRGSRLVSFDEAELLGEPVVGYLGYDAVARIEPTVPLPEDGPDFPESRFLVPDVLVRFDHARGVAEMLVGEAASLEGPQPEPPRGTGTSGPLQRYPDRDEHLKRIARAKEYIREGDVFQVVVAQRAVRPTSASPAELYRALRRVNPSPYLFLLELDDIALVGSSPETVVKCEGSRATLNPIAGTIAPARATPKRCFRPRRIEPSTSCSSTSAATTCHACASRLGPRRAFMEAGAVLARDAPRLRGGGRAARRPDAVLAPPRVLPGGNRVGRTEGARDADHLRARGLPPRRLRRRRRLRLSGRAGDGHLHRDQDVGVS